MEQYGLQLQIYTLATCYWFKINFKEKYEERFGGAIYLFMRGIGSNSNNSDRSLTQSNRVVFFKRPSWEEFLDYEKNIFLIDY